MRVDNLTFILFYDLQLLSIYCTLSDYIPALLRHPCAVCQGTQPLSSSCQLCVVYQLECLARPDSDGRDGGHLAHVKNGGQVTSSKDSPHRGHSISFISTSIL